MGHSPSFKLYGEESNVIILPFISPLEWMIGSKTGMVHDEGKWNNAQMAKILPSWRGKGAFPCAKEWDLTKWCDVCTNHSAHLPDKSRVSEQNEEAEMNKEKLNAYMLQWTKHGIVVGKRTWGVTSYADLLSNRIYKNPAHYLFTASFGPVISSHSLFPSIHHISSSWLNPASKTFNYHHCIVSFPPCMQVLAICIIHPYRPPHPTVTKCRYITLYLPVLPVLHLTL